MIGIGDFDGKGRNTRKVCTRPGQVLYKGKKFAQDPRTGYYTCTTGKKRMRLHDYMWLTENNLEELPDGCVVHHIDWDKTHNEITNLTCITVYGHSLIHNPPKDTSKYTVKIVPGGVSEVIENK